MELCLISVHSQNFYLQKSSFICRIDLNLFLCGDAQTKAVCAVYKNKMLFL
jgi:hypothetical protein